MTLATCRPAWRPTRRGRKEAKLDREYRKNFREVTDLWSGLRIRRRPLTMALVIASVIVFLLQHSSPSRRIVLSALSFTTDISIPSTAGTDDGLAPILSGQVWRLVTPIFPPFRVPPYPVQLLGHDRWRER